MERLDQKRVFDKRSKPFPFRIESNQISYLSAVEQSSWEEKFNIRRTAATVGCVKTDKRSDAG